MSLLPTLGRKLPELGGKVMAHLGPCAGTRIPWNSATRPCRRYLTDRASARRCRTASNGGNAAAVGLSPSAPWLACQKRKFSECLFDLRPLLARIALGVHLS